MEDQVHVEVVNASAVEFRTEKLEFEVTATKEKEEERYQSLGTRLQRLEEKLSLSSQGEEVAAHTEHTEITEITELTESSATSSLHREVISRRVVERLLAVEKVGKVHHEALEAQSA